MAPPAVYTNTAYLNLVTPFIPLASEITGISNTNPAVVTTASNNGYMDGLEVRIVLPGDFGINVLNGQQFYITVLTPTTFSIPFDARYSDAFAVGSNLTPAQCIPIGEVASSLLQAVQNSGVLEVFAGNGP
jgi:hypothetical protein